MSALIEMSLGEAVVSVGASGAIFGIFGVMLVMIFKNRQRMGQVSAPRLIILFGFDGIWKYGRRMWM